MLNPQIERLKRDYRELEYYERSLIKRGQTEKAFVISKKKDYLNCAIDELTEELSKRRG